MFSQVLASMKAVKMTGCATAVREKIIAARTNEIKVSQKYRGALIFSVVMCEFWKLRFSPTVWMADAEYCQKHTAPFPSRLRSASVYMSRWQNRTRAHC